MSRNPPCIGAEGGRAGALSFLDGTQCEGPDIDPRNLHGYRIRSYRTRVSLQIWRRLSWITYRYRSAPSKDGTTFNTALISTRDHGRSLPGVFDEKRRVLLFRFQLKKKKKKTHKGVENARSTLNHTRVLHKYGLIARSGETRDVQ